jgi:two-component system cell cycle sensor histidine kinase/response regulator CckA
MTTTDTDQATELAQRDAQLQILLQNLHVGVVIHKKGGEIALCNGRALTLLGLTEAQLLGQRSIDPMWEVVHEDGSPFPGEQHPSMVALATGQPVQSVVMGVTRPIQRDQVWLLVSAQPHHDAGGEIAQVIVTFTDITDRKRLEETLHRTERLKSIGALASGIAHDFNNLLTIIIASADVAQYAALDMQDHAIIAQELSCIIDASKRAAKLTHQILRFARRSVSPACVISPDEVIQQMTPLLHRSLGVKVRLSFDLNCLGWCVVLDPSQLEQIILNISANARDAMPNGGELCVCTSPVQLDATRAVDLSLRAGDYVELRFQDSGEGIPPDVIAHVFEPFFTTKALDHGTGLGLSTVHGIVQSAQGYIAIESALGQGTTFRVLLPRSTHAMHPLTLYPEATP